MEEARKNDEVISLADSQILRWIDELNGTVDADTKAREIKAEIKKVRKEPNSVQNRREMRRLYAELDDIQFKPDYMCLIIDKEKDYYRACRGFSINGVKYARLLGTNGGIKNSTIVFVSERLSGELRKRIENGRDTSVPLVPAKLEAYKALTCSASTPVSFPKGILVVNDCETIFSSDIVYLTDEGVDEPIMEERKDQEIQLNASDGYGLMHPTLAERWSEELNLGYVVSGVNTRFSFEKGMVFTFDFKDFAEKEANAYIVKDAWGDEVDIRGVELILTTSMVKLWDSYKSCDDYIKCSTENGYTFGIAKTCPRELETERNLNYQFIQSYDLSDDDIEELIKPTMDEIKDVLSGDWRKTILYLKGAGLNEDKVDRLENDIAKAIMIDSRMIHDPYIQSSIYRLIKNRINEAKVGVLKVHGNYSIVSGDPFALCQSIFGMEVTGLLKAGEVYNQYWVNKKTERLACFRAPMTCHNNIRIVEVPSRDDIKYWYRYMDTCTILNAWDTTCSALNGCDFDGDLVMLTDNNVLVSKLKPSPALMCAQRRAEKCIPDENDFIKSNISSFGNDIGATTNWITSMFEVQSHFDKDSDEYKILDYRIKCGQLFQQNAIDKAKGIVCKPMPRYWHDRHSVNKMQDGVEKDLCRAIVADKKPYFMIYIYPKLMKQYKNYIKNTDRSALVEFQKTVNELKSKSLEDLSDREREFLRYYDMSLPVGIGDCVMNKICRRFEDEFDKYISRHNANHPFDYTFMKSGADYGKHQYNEIKKLYCEYNEDLKDFSIKTNIDRVSGKGQVSSTDILYYEFRKRCDKVCQNEIELCDIIIDICYKRNATKTFAWNMCAKTIIHNLLSKNDYRISYPTISSSGDIEFAGQKFTMQEKYIGEMNEYNFK